MTKENKNQTRYIQNEMCVYKEIDEDTGYVLRLDDSDFFYEMTNIVNKLWLKLESEMSLADIEIFCSNLYNGAQEESNKICSEILTTLLEQQVITKKDSK